MKSSAIMPCHVTKTVTELEGTGLALHVWQPEHSKGVVAYVHGLQSHAGWSWELALDFCSRNVTFMCIDRRGSGLSVGDHRSFAETNTVIDDYTKFLEFSFEKASGKPVVAVGHCLGGSVLSAVLATRPDVALQLSSAVLVSSWIGRLSRCLNEDQLRAIAQETSKDLWDAGLRAEDFTSSPAYQEFINNDHLAINSIRSNTRKNILGLEERYLHWEAPPGMRSRFISSFEDPVIDVQAAIEASRSVFGSQMSVHLLGNNKHYIPFSSARAEMVDIISGDIQS